jgi:hypothetical protein
MVHDKEENAFIFMPPGRVFVSFFFFFFLSRLPTYSNIRLPAYMSRVDKTSLAVSLSWLVPFFLILGLLDCCHRLSRLGVHQYLQHLHEEGHHTLTITQVRLQLSCCTYGRRAYNLSIVWTLNFALTKSQITAWEHFYALSLLPFCCSVATCNFHCYPWKEVSFSLNRK